MMQMTYEEITDTLSYGDIRNYVKDGHFFSEAVIGIFQKKIVDVFYLYYFDTKTDIVYPPFARIAVDSAEKTLAYYYKTDKKPFAGVLPDNFVSAKPYDDMYKKCSAVYEDCYCKIREFAFKTGLADEQKDILKDFLQAFDYIIDKELQPFYFELSPEFWEWLAKNAC